MSDLNKNIRMPEGFNLEDFWDSFDVNSANQNFLELIGQINPESPAHVDWRKPIGLAGNLPNIGDVLRNNWQAFDRGIGKDQTIWFIVYTGSEITSVELSR